MTQDSLLNTRIWISDGTNYEFAEQSGGLPATPNTGVCFSGGGTRALTAAMGQLRGLTSLGLMGNIRYISCVSGGSWAATPYTYYTSGPANDAEFLGPITSPQDIKMADLAILPQTCLGYTATQSLAGAIIMAKWFVPDDQLWIFAVGVTYLYAFGLFPYLNQSYFSLDAATVADIKNRNPSLADATFYTVRTDAPRPYLIVNSSLVGPASLAPYWSESLVGFEYTPLYVGSPKALEVTYQPDFGPTTRLVGGGFIEPFAMGSSAPADPPSGGFVNVGPPPAPFTLADASGTSSSAFVGIIEKATSDFSPQQPYWPVTNSGGEPTEVYAFGDGGILENLGVISLLLRQVETIVVFINTETKLNLSYKPKPKIPPTSTDFDNDTPPLFGYGTGPTANNQVFNQSDFVTLVQNLQDAKAAGATAMTTITHTVLENQWWGVEGGWDVTICWVYLDRVANWESQLGDADVKAAIMSGNQPTPSGPFRYFPNYWTIDEDPGVLPSLVTLTKDQVNLMADLTCWDVTENGDAFKALLAPLPPAS